jgi:hypothetical protein
MKKPGLGRSGLYEGEFNQNSEVSHQGLVAICSGGSHAPLAGRDCSWNEGRIKSGPEGWHNSSPVCRRSAVAEVRPALRIRVNLRAETGVSCGLSPVRGPEGRHNFSPV